MDNIKFYQVSPRYADYLVSYLKKECFPQYGTVMRKGNQYYSTRITDADGRQVSLYAVTGEELYRRELKTRRQVIPRQPLL